jgi:putative membrane protein
MRRTPLVLALLVLAAAWLGPLPALAARAFAAHMTVHMAIVAVAAPLLALSVRGGPFDPARRIPAIFAPIPASLVELLVVWLWHAPVLHHAARHHTGAFVIEQGSFLFAGLFLWLSAFGGDPRVRQARAAAGVVALLLTSVHMTLLGALLALTTRALYLHENGLTALSSLEDQHLGGAIMLLVGGASYLLGGIWLTTVLLRNPELIPRQER